MFWTVGFFAILFLLGYGAWQVRWMRWVVGYLLMLAVALTVYQVYPSELTLLLAIFIGFPLALPALIIFGIPVAGQFLFSDGRVRRDRW